MMKKLCVCVELDEWKVVEVVEVEVWCVVEVVEEDDEIERRRARREAKLEVKCVRYKVVEERLSK